MANLSSVPSTAADPLANIDTATLANDELGLLVLCGQLGEMALANESTVIGRVQRAFQKSNHTLAVLLLGEYLESNGLNVRRRRYVIDGQRLSDHRGLRGLTQAQLAAKIGSTPGQVSHVETGKSGLGLLKLLLTLSALGISAEAILAKGNS